MQFSTLALAFLASTVTAFPIWNPVIVRYAEPAPVPAPIAEPVAVPVAAPVAAPEVHAFVKNAPNAAVPRDVPYPTGTGKPMPTGTGYYKAPTFKRWVRPASPPAPQPVSRSPVQVYPRPNPIEGRSPAPWFAAL